MWTRQDIDDKLVQLQDTSNFWPKNPIPLRAKIEYHCTERSPNYYPCNQCNSKRQPCKFRTNNLWRPIVEVWQLEYMIPDGIYRLESFLRDRDHLINEGFVDK